MCRNISASVRNECTRPHGNHAAHPVAPAGGRHLTTARAIELPFEYLRVHSPSAEVKGHGPGQEVLVTGKENVGIRAVEPVGQYAVKLVFDDGHDTGLYTWKYLYELGSEREARWLMYLQRLEQAG